MDGRRNWTDNVFIERLCSSLKHEDVQLKGYADGRELRERARRLDQLLQQSCARPSHADVGLALWPCRTCWTTQERCPHAHFAAWCCANLSDAFESSAQVVGAKGLIVAVAGRNPATIHWRLE